MGSGSSPGGVTRNKSGGLKPGDIISEEDMLYSESTTRNPSIDEALSVDRAIVGMYGEGAVVSSLVVGDLRDGSVMGYYKQDGTLGISGTFMESEKMTGAYDACVAAGFHPSRGNKTGTEAVVAHEYGHALNDKVAQKLGVDMDTAAKKIVSEARKQTKTKTGKSKHRGIVQFENAISRYATTNEAEAIAEAFSDVFCNGGKAKAESKAIMKVLDGYMK